MNIIYCLQYAKYFGRKNLKEPNTIPLDFCPPINQNLSNNLTSSLCRTIVLKWVEKKMLLIIFNQ